MRSDPSAPPASPLPVDADFDALFDIIEARANAGDVDARCALGLLLTHCGLLLDPPAPDSPDQGWLESLRRLAEREARTPDVLARWDEMRAGDREKCERIAPSHPRPALWNFIEAARRGHVPSMRRTVRGMGLNEAALLRDPLLYEAYRTEAGAMLVRLLELGDPWAVELWVDALREDPGNPLSAVIPARWRTPGVALALKQEIARNTEYLRSVTRRGTITSEDRVRAEALYAKHFAQSRILQEGLRRMSDDLKSRPRSGRDLARPPLRECGIDASL